MGIFQDLSRWRDERVRLSELRYSLNDIEKLYQADLSKLQQSTDEYAAAYSEFRSQMEVYEFESESIETRKRIRKAQRYEVPIPSRPAQYEDNEFWYWHHYQQHFLTQDGHAHLRREVAREHEIYYKPIQNLIAMSTGILGLVISFVTAFFS